MATTVSSTKTNESRRRDAPGPGAPGPGGPQTPARAEGAEDFRALLDQRDRLYDEARKHPESEAADLARTFLLSGMLAGQRGAGGDPGGAWEQNARLERTVLDQQVRLDAIAQAIEQGQAKVWDAKAICAYVADVVGLRPPPQPGQQEYPSGAPPRSGNPAGLDQSWRPSGKRPSELRRERDPESK